ncbi:hypothetical protein GCM10010245_87580 [Streptomyces spectabilis]|uniref:Uncharacterized protein n=1 Tax=Streptomyces spectabilis TaxID=68270 RepID=A0A7W8B4E5_STRST|nr:hypothetical protein [Streptomyces spectabilis]MBB5109727.1 hypothetical protein [Streptomyces spectabilis]GGV55312.1 hypothetical protein GCM10010245_87580 [Streptomyces spectabilis]
MAGFLPIELGVDAAPEEFVGEVRGQVGAAVQAAEFHEGLAGGSEFASGGQDAQGLGGFDGAGVQRAGQAEHLVPVRGDLLEVDLVAGDGVERSVVGVRVGAVEDGAADVSEAG